MGASDRGTQHLLVIGDRLPVGPIVRVIHSPRRVLPPMKKQPIQRAPVYQDLLQTLLWHHDGRGRVGPESLPLSQSRRITHQFLTAVRTAGIPKSVDYVRRSYEWLIQSGVRPATELDHYLCLNKIEAAIEFGDARSEFCVKAIDMLGQRRRSALNWEVPTERTVPFVSLWVAKILLSLGDKESTRIAAETVDGIAENHAMLQTARDRSLLIRLYLQVHPDSDPSKGKLRELLSAMEHQCRSGLFDVSVELEKVLGPILRDGLNSDVVATLSGDLYGALISTCYVMENLSGIEAKDAGMGVKIEASAQALLRILDPERRPVREVYGEAYKQVMISARAIIGLQAVFGDDVATLVSPYLLQEVVNRQRSQAAERSEYLRAQLRKVVHSWIQVDWDADDEQRLAGGYSKATIVRVRPTLRIPSADGDSPRKERIPGVESLILKYGSKTNLDRERRNYKSIPPEFERLFAAIPRGAHKQIESDQVVEYLIIEDLAEYKTLEEIVDQCDESVAGYVADSLLEFLRVLYAMRPIVAQNDPGLRVRDLYVTPLQRSIETIQDLRLRFSSLDRTDHDVTDDIYFLFGVSQRLDDFPLTVMHGDLNCRNLLVKGPLRRGADLRFKLIDLDRFSRCGDRIYDLGELLVDNGPYKRRLEEEHWENGDGHVGRERINSALLRFVKEARNGDGKADRYQQARLHLSRARSLAKLLEVWSRRGMELYRSDVVSRENSQRIHHRVSSFVPQLYDWIASARKAAIKLGIEWPKELDRERSSEPPRVVRPARPIGSRANASRVGQKSVKKKAARAESPRPSAPENDKPEGQ